MREQLKKEAEAVTIFAKDRDNMARYDEDGGTIKLSRATFARLADLIARQDAYIDGLGWQPTESAPMHKNILLYREDAGVFEGILTYCAEWFSEKEQESYTEEELWAMDFWSFDHQGAHRMEGNEKPTDWMPLPAAPEQLTKREE